MPEGFDYFKTNLLATCEITNPIIAIPVKTRATQVVAEVLPHRVICIFGLPKLLRFDKHSIFTEKVNTFILRTINFILKIIRCWEQKERYIP